jgi:N-dimethylarginine dimethylaminohydrolase
MQSLITSKDQIKSALNRAVTIPVPGNVLMVTPEYFSVDYVINPHMEGNIGKVDKIKARWEWEVIRDKFRHLGITVHELPGQPGFPDMVFSANQSLPLLDSKGRKHALMSLMHSEQRREEVPYFEQWYRRHGYEVHYLDSGRIPDFEGMGDAIWHFKKCLLWGGYGYRSSPEAYKYISETFDVPVVALELMHPSFYHLDTCFCVLNANTVMIYPGAFSEEGLGLIRSAFTHVIEAPEDEALKRFACNAVCPDGRNVIIQKGCTEVNKALKKLGFAFHEVDTTEYIKSGGSVFCMKLMVW